MAVALHPPPLLVDDFLPGSSTMARNRLDSGSTSDIQRTLSYRDRALPPIPQQNPTTSPRPRLRSTDTVRSTTTSISRPFSTILPLQTRRVNLPIILKQKPRVLEQLLTFLSWSDFFSLANTCRDCRNLLGPLGTKDIVLSRFVFGYRHAVRSRDLRRFRDVPVSLHDLDLLREYQVFSTSIPSTSIHYRSKSSSQLHPKRHRSIVTLCTPHKLVTLALAHSRAILLLQSIVHSSLSPIPPEPREDTKSTLRNLQRPVLRELTFPAPLSYQHSERSAQSMEESVTRSRLINGHSKSNSESGTATSLHRRQRQNKPTAAVSSSADQAPSLTLKAKKRLSKLVPPPAPPPPPPAALPRALKFYSGGWRRASRVPSAVTQSDDEGGRTAAGGRTSMIASPHGSISPKRPHNRFTAVNTSSDSSIDSGPLSRSSTGDVPLSSLGSTPSPSGSSNVSCNSLAPPPHDLGMATCRARAPILRVFVPCTELSDAGASLSIRKCREQLVESRLWDHLSEGDIVCNLGFIPGGLRAAADDLGALIADIEDADPAQGQKWLVFDGENLVPFSPPSPPPIPDPLTLPSPFYYTHIMPALANPTFILDQLPWFHEGPQLTLMHASTRVRSPHSPNGYAVVKKYMWLARVVRRPPAAGEIDDTSDSALGEGWMGEWILEGEGTREGRQALLQCFDRSAGEEAMVRREFELVRDKSGGGKLWFKLLHSYTDIGDPTDNTQTLI